MHLKPAETSHTQAGTAQAATVSPYEKSNGSIIRANGHSNDERSSVQKMQQQIAVKDAAVKTQQQIAVKDAAVKMQQIAVKERRQLSKERNESDQGSDT